MEEQTWLQSQVLTQMVDGVTVLDSRGIIVYTNPALDVMFGYEHDELVGEHVSMLNALPRCS